MTKFTVVYRTILEQSVAVDIDEESLYEGEDVFEAALDKAYDNLSSVPFIGWQFDTTGDWEPTFARNLDTGDEQEFGW